MSDRLSSALNEVLANTTPPGEIRPVEGYSAFWVQLGWVLVFLGILAVLLVLLRTRPPAPPKPERPLPKDALALRNATFARIQDVEAQVSQGKLTPREAHASLSRILREFAAEASNIPTDRMTLTELQYQVRRGTTRLGGVTQAVGNYYPQVFAPDSHQSIARGIDIAKATVARWW